jgi:hypothetical protein
VRTNGNQIEIGVHMKNPEIEAANAGQHEARNIYLDLRRSRNELVQPVLDAKAKLDEAIRLYDELVEWAEEWDTEVGDEVMVMAQNGMDTYNIALDEAVEQFVKRHAAVVTAKAEYKNKSEVYYQLSALAREDSSNRSRGSIAPRVNADEEERKVIPFRSYKLKSSPA